MNRAVAFDSTHPGKNRRAQGHMEMAFATFAMPCVAAVLFAFVSDHNRHWRKSCL